jgi:tellurite resistance protein TerC
MSVDRHLLFSEWGSSWKENLQLTLNVALSKDNHYTLFRSEDWPAWVSFTTIFTLLIIFDNTVLHRNPQAMTMTRAFCYTLFWIFCAFGFAGYVYWWYGRSQAFMWMSGYMLEWMLSFDNLFVFHLIFNVYATPDHLKHKPLYLGICGAVVFRLIFIFIGEYLMHAMMFMHFVFGSFLVYTGVKTATTDDDDEDPSQHPLVQMLQRRVPFVSAYDEKGAFFVRVPVNEHGEAMLPDTVNTRSWNQHTEGDLIMAAEGGCSQESRVRYGTVDVAAACAKNQARAGGKGQTRATMLFLVVCCLEISDILFAVDSVSAIVAQVNDLFLAYTSAVFAMLGLRATFFIIDELAKLFTLLKYGVAAVLIFIGVKLITSRLYHIPPGWVCLVLVSFIGLSMVASVIQDRFKGDEEEDGKKTPETHSPVPKLRVA